NSSTGDLEELPTNASTPVRFWSSFWGSSSSLLLVGSRARLDALIRGGPCARAPRRRAARRLRPSRLPPARRGSSPPTRHVAAGEGRSGWRAPPPCPASAVLSRYCETMAYRARWGGAVLSALLLSLVCASCAVLSGLDGYSQAACSGACDGGADRSAPRDAFADANLNGYDEGVDAPDVLADDETEAAGDAAGDEQPVVPSDGGTEDAPTEAGCALGTPAHCSACGVACSSGTGAPTCSNSTCSYACAAGRQDCNAST